MKERAWLQKDSMCPLIMLGHYLAAGLSLRELIKSNQMPCSNSMSGTFDCIPLL